MAWVETLHTECEFPKWSDDDQFQRLTGSIWKCGTAGCNKLWMLVVEVEGGSWVEVIKTESLAKTGRVVPLENYFQYVDNDPVLQARRKREWESQQLERMESLDTERSQRQADLTARSVASFQPSAPTIWKRGFLSLKKSW